MVNLLQCKCFFLCPHFIVIFVLQEGYWFLSSSNAVWSGKSKGIISVIGIDQDITLTSKTKEMPLLGELVVTLAVLLYVKNPKPSSWTTVKGSWCEEMPTWRRQGSGIISEEKTDLEGIISMLEEKIRTENYIDSLAGKHENQDEILLRKWKYYAWAQRMQKIQNI